MKNYFKESIYYLVIIELTVIISILISSIVHNYSLEFWKIEVIELLYYVFLLWIILNILYMVIGWYINMAKK